MNILVTGGAGYIGSHTVIELLKAGHTPIVVDSLINSSKEPLKRCEEITGATIPFHEVNLCDKAKLNDIFSSCQVDAVIHFAGLKAVGESVEKPLLYYRNNLDSTLSLLECMKQYNVKKLVFSSSATVYGSAPFPYVETYETGRGITSPYGKTKHMIETILLDTTAEDREFECSILRYFNPVGAHESGLIGEDPKGTPNNLMPFIAQTAAGRREKLLIFGGDYATPDGTCVRDYLHVIDLAKGHIAALEHLKLGCTAYNLGSGQGTSVLELVNGFMNATSISIPYEFAPRRSGDLPAFYADVSKAEQELGWKATLDIEKMCRDTWNWQSKNPNGFET